MPSRDWLIRARFARCRTTFPYTFSQEATIQSAKGWKECVLLIDRYRSAGLTSIAHDFYSGGRHEMLHEINRRDVITNLLVWISGLVNEASGSTVTGRR